MSAISEHHQEEITKFLHFFRGRLKTHLENVEATFEDTRSDRLSADDVYSQKDIREVLTSLCFAVESDIRSELQDTINMMALLLRQIFSEAEQSSLSLALEIGQVEDKELLQRVEKLSVQEWASDGNAAASKASKKTPTAQQQREKRYEEELRAARHTSEVQQEEHAKDMRRLHRKLQDAEDTITSLERQVDEATQHVSQTKQFQAMKKMVTQKNEQLQALRARLKRYEPDCDGDDGETKDADD